MASGAGTNELLGEMIFVITSWFCSMHQQKDNSNRFFLLLPFISFRPNFAFYLSGRIALHMCCRMLHSPFQNHHVLFCGNVRFFLYELWNSVSFRLFLLQFCNPCSSVCVPTFRTTPLQIWAISVSIRSLTRSHSGNALPFSTLIVRLAWDFEFVQFVFASFFATCASQTSTSVLHASQLARLKCWKLRGGGTKARSTLLVLYRKQFTCKNELMNWW